ncbi:MAG TPA: hypothetical protein VF108_03855 [Actinomycetota bacterium]
MGAATDWRIPMRVGVAITALVLASSVLVLVSRRGLVGAPGGSREPRTANRLTRILVAVYALFGATIAVLVTIRQDDYWVRGTPSFSTRSFLGWDMTPVLAETLVAIAGAAGGIALGLLVSRMNRRVETSGALTAARREST